MVASVGLLSWTQPARAQVDVACEIDAREREHLLSLGYRDFDQTPAEGWRALVNADFACAPEVAGLIDEYASTNGGDLTDYNVQILSWHAGQLYGFAGQTDRARERFKASLDPTEAADAPPWNAYVRASLAFLDDDLAELQRQRALIAGPRAR